jgi:rhamnosyltransferase subunit B
MTHFIVASIGTYGDIFPFSQVGIALQNLGHKVTFITNPYFKDTIQQFGLNFYGIGSKDQYMKVLMSAGLWNDQDHFDVVSSLFVPNLFGIDEFVSQLDSDEKIVIITQQNFIPNAGIAQAKRKDITIICGALYPSVFRTSPKVLNIGPFSLSGKLKAIAWYFIAKGLDRQYLKSPLIVPLNKVRKENGLKPIGKYPDLFNKVASFNVLLFSSWLGSTHPLWPNNLIPGDFLLKEEQSTANFSPALSEFLEEGDKPILFTFGTGNMHAQKYLEASLGALKLNKQRAIFICKDESHLPKDLPENIFWLPHFDNFSELLKRCSLLVYHGGIGTLAEAARCGVPQLLIPSLGDQWDNAERIEKLHLGGAIAIHELNQELLAEKINSILQSPKIAATSKDIQKVMTNRVSASIIAKRIIDTTNS